MKNKEYVGYITFFKNNNSDNNKNFDEYLDKYTRNNVIVGENIHEDKTLIVTKRLEESFHGFSSEAGIQNWDNLTFAKVKSNDYKLLDRFYYLEPAIITKDIEVVDILNKKDVLNLIKYELDCRYTEGIIKYLQFIKFDENEKDFIKNNTTNGFGDKINTAISYYQDGDKDAYEKANSIINKPVRRIKKKEGK